MNKCYVDGNFKVTESRYAAKGIVHEVGSKKEIIFFAPIAHNKTLSEAWSAMMKYGRRVYPGKSFHFPSLKGCLLANYAEETPKIVSCFSCSTTKNREATKEWLCVDEKGEECIAQERMENVYIAVTLSHDEFYHINPWFDMRSFLTKLSR